MFPVTGNKNRPMGWEIVRECRDCSEGVCESDSRFAGPVAPLYCRHNSAWSGEKRLTKAKAQSAAVFCVDLKKTFLGVVVLLETGPLAPRDRHAAPLAGVERGRRRYCACATSKRQVSASLLFWRVHPQVLLVFTEWHVANWFTAGAARPGDPLARTKSSPLCFHAVSNEELLPIIWVGGQALFQ